MISEIKIAEYTYDLPEKRIAKFPLENRADSKLLVFKDARINDSSFSDVVTHIAKNSLLVFNNTKVIQARLQFQKTKGAKPIEVFCLEPAETDVERAMAAVGHVTFYALVGNAKRWNDGLKLKMNLSSGTVLQVEKLRREGESFVVKFMWDGRQSFSEILEEAGKVPLPPYLRRDSQPGDKERYQTVYAETDGSVAAPTAGLHFTPQIIDELKEKGITIAETTLHVGAGTFKPVSSDDVREHEMHAEEIHITLGFLQAILANKGPLITVGTTSTRTLESLYWMGVKVHSQPQIQLSELQLLQWDAYKLPQKLSLLDAIQALINLMLDSNTTHFFTKTQLIITPGYNFRVIDGLFTNFHQPGSTLILLVAAAIGGSWKDVYRHALESDYRFLSYGDSSLLLIPEENKTKSV